MYSQQLIENSSSITNFFKGIFEQLEKFKKESGEQVEHLTNISNEIPENLSTEDKQALMSLVRDIEIKSQRQLNDLKIIQDKVDNKILEIKNYLETIKDVKGPTLNLKNTLGTNMDNYVAIFNNYMDDLRTKFLDISDILEVLKDSDNNFSVKKIDSKIHSLVKDEIKKALLKYQNPLDQIKEMAKLDTCTTVSCLKNQIAILQKEMLNMNSALSQISKVIANEIDKIASSVEANKAANHNCKMIIDNMADTFTKDINDFKYLIINRIRNIEDNQSSEVLKKYYI